MELDMLTIGQRIKERRKELNLTQLDIKSKVGISSGNLSDIENGNRLPAASTLLQLAKALECSVDYILTGAPLISEKYNSSVIGESEQELLTIFHSLSPDDQYELIRIAEIKADKGKRTQNAKSSLSCTSNITYETA